LGNPKWRLTGQLLMGGDRRSASHIIGSGDCPRMRRSLI
jgi:hypothetical protein